MVIHMLKETPDASGKYMTFFLMRSWIEDYVQKEILK